MRDVVTVNAFMFLVEALPFFLLQQAVVCWSGRS